MKCKTIFRRLFVAASILVVAFALLGPRTAHAQIKSLYQLQSEHVDLRFGMFIHFNMNTFFPGWAETRTDPKTFNPTSLNTTQWATAAKSAKMRYGLLTTKHHDGFAIWPSKQTAPNGLTPYTIAQSSTPTRDVVREYVDSFRAQGLLPGLYFSMWDTANIGGTYDAPGYTDNGNISWNKVKGFILGQITELLGGTYGDIPIFVIDGWSWSMGHRSVPYQEIRALIKRLQPNCLIVDHNGALPWEVDVMYFEEPLKIQAPAGNTIASCQGQTISGDWFWDSTAASASSLMTAADIVSHLTRLQPLYTNFRAELSAQPARATGSSDRRSPGSGWNDVVRVHPRGAAHAAAGDRVSHHRGVGHGHQRRYFGFVRDRRIERLQRRTAPPNDVAVDRRPTPVGDTRSGSPLQQHRHPAIRPQSRQRYGRHHLVSRLRKRRRHDLRASRVGHMGGQFQHQDGAVHTANSQLHSFGSRGRQRRIRGSRG